MTKGDQMSAILEMMMDADGKKPKARPRMRTLRGQTYPEIVGAIRSAREMFADPTRDERLGRWDDGHLIEAMAADFATLPQEVQLARLSRGLAVVRKIQARGKAGLALTESDAPEAARGPRAVVDLNGGAFQKDNAPAKVEPSPKRPRSKKVRPVD
jgi:hypothetical protein